MTLILIGCKLALIVYFCDFGAVLTGQTQNSRSFRTYMRKVDIIITPH